MYSRALLSLERALWLTQATSLVFCTWLAARCIAPARAQPSPATFTLSVDVAPPAAQGAECWKLELLHERIAHYTAPHASYMGLHVEVQVEQPVVAQLTLRRGDQTLARRRITELPEVCADRLDTLALAIAMALEHAPSAATVKGDGSGALPAPATSQHTRANVAVGRPAAAGILSQQRSSPPASQASAVSSVAAPAQDGVRNSVSEPSQRVAFEPRAGQPQAREETPVASSRRTGRNGRATFLRLGAGLLSNAAPTPIFAFQLAVELQLSPAYSLAAAALVSNEAEERLAGGAVEVRLLGGELRGCRLWLAERLGVETCLGAAAAACRAQGSSFPVRLPTTTAAWGAALLRVALRWPQAAAVSLAFVLTGHANVMRPELRVQGSGARLAPSWLGGSAGLELVFRLL